MPGGCGKAKRCFGLDTLKESSHNGLKILATRLKPLSPSTVFAAMDAWLWPASSTYHKSREIPHDTRFQFDCDIIGSLIDATDASWPITGFRGVCDLHSVQTTYCSPDRGLAEPCCGWSLSKAKPIRHGYGGHELYGLASYLTSPR